MLEMARWLNLDAHTFLIVRQAPSQSSTPNSRRASTTSSISLSFISSIIYYASYNLSSHSSVDTICCKMLFNLVCSSGFLAITCSHSPNGRAMLSGVVIHFGRIWRSLWQLFALAPVLDSSKSSSYNHNFDRACGLFI